MSKKTVLIVDDEDSVRITLRIALGRRGHTTTLAENAQTALEILESDPPDVVITDVNMPGRLNGFDLVHTLRDSVEYKGRIIMMSRNPSNDIKMTGLLLLDRIQGILPKPFENEKLYRLVEDRSW